MTLHYDDKGKFFTDYISKDAVQTVIQTSTNRIRGNMYVRAGERVSDYLNKSADFLPITDAEIYDLNGNRLYRAPFLAVNMNLVVWVMPQEKVNDDYTPDDESDVKAP